MNKIEDIAAGETVNGVIRGGWLDSYLDLRAAGLHWKKAAFAAWYNAPKRHRKPRTMRELAELLNYKSEQVFYKWQNQEWFKTLGIDLYRERIFQRYVGDVDRATIRAAIHDEGGAGVQARKLFYEQLMPPSLRIEHSGPQGGPIQTRYESLSDDELNNALREALGIAADRAQTTITGDDSGSGQTGDAV